MTDSSDSLVRLEEGNARFVSGATIHPNIDMKTRTRTAREGQTPFAAILSCADSRAPIELVFDQGIGDIFSVRNAGNIYDDIAIGTLEIAVTHFNSPVMIVLGHTDCGAIKLAIEGKVLKGNMMKVIDRIVPIVDLVRANKPDLRNAKFLLEVTKENTLNTMEEIKAKSELIRSKVEKGELRLIAGIHYLDSGKVEWLE